MNREALSSTGLLWLRVVAGLSIAYHGYGKVFGGHMDGFARGVGGMGFPAPVAFAWAAALSELVGGVLVAIGLKTRVAAVAVCVTMTVAAFVRHGSDPFSVKELALVFWAAFGAIALVGPGRFSLDRS